MAYIQVAEDESSEAIELPVEDDGTLLFSTLAGQFPGICSLNYRNEESKSLRAVKLLDGMLHPPEGGWCDRVYFCVFPKDNKRKSDESDNGSSKLRKVETKCSDLIVLGLPWKTSDETLKEHFEQFGEVVMAQVKMNVNTQKSKGFGFIRMANYPDQIRVLSQRHRIDGRWCDVKIPNSKIDIHRYGQYRESPYGMMGDGNPPYTSCKIFVGRCTEDMTSDDLRDYFSQFGEVIDVFIPKPFRAFAFVTFIDASVAQNLIGEDHIIKGNSVVVTSATPKGSSTRFNYRGQDTRGGGRDAMMNSMDTQNGPDRNQGPGPSPQGNPSVGMGPGGPLNLPSFPLDSAIVTAALNQAGWGFLSNLQQGGGGSGGGGGGGGGGGYQQPNSGQPGGQYSNNQQGYGQSNSAGPNSGPPSSYSSWMNQRETKPYGNMGGTPSQDNRAGSMYNRRY